MKQQIKKPITRHELVTKILDEFEKYKAATGALLDDYAVSTGLVNELAEKDREFTAFVEDIDVDIAHDFDKIIEAVRTFCRYRRIDPVDIKTLVKTIGLDEVLEAIDGNAIADFVRANGEIIIRVEAMADRQKLEDFLRQEIYPYNINNLEGIF
jgi:hypothetical protein